MTRKDTAASLLRELRQAQGTSLRSAAGALDVAPSYLSRLERGERGYSREFGERLASYYGVPSERLLLEEGRVPEDIARILREHPQEMEALRARYRDR